MAAPIAVYLQGGVSIDYTPPSAVVAAGDVVVLGVRCGVAKLAIAVLALGALCINGVFTMPKGVGSADALGVGVVVYWDATNEVVTTTSAGNTVFGETIAAAAADAATVRVLLHW